MYSHSRHTLKVHSYISYLLQAFQDLLRGADPVGVQTHSHPQGAGDEHGERGLPHGRSMVRSVVVELGLAAAALRVSYSLYAAYTRVSYSLYAAYTRVSYRILRSNLSVGIKFVTEVNTSHTPDAQPIHSQAVYNDSNVEAEFLCVGVLGRVLGCWDGGCRFL